jgi:hypothetical protein
MRAATRRHPAPVAEPADAADSKSASRKGVGVRVSPGAPMISKSSRNGRDRMSTKAGPGQEAVPATSGELCVHVWTAASSPWARRWRRAYPSRNRSDEVEVVATSLLAFAVDRHPPEYLRTRRTGRRRRRLPADRPFAANAATAPSSWAVDSVDDRRSPSLPTAPTATSIPAIPSSIKQLLAVLFRQCRVHRNRVQLKAGTDMIKVAAYARHSGSLDQGPDPAV